MKKRLRTQFIVYPRMQYKLIFLTLLSILIPTIITFLSLFFMIQSLLIDAKLDDEMVYAALMFLSHRIYLILGSGFVAITVLLLMWVTLFFHRIVGPIYRLEHELEKAVQGEHIPKIRFRKTDYIKSVADKINILIERARPPQ